MPYALNPFTGYLDYYAAATGSSASAGVSSLNTLTGGVTIAPSGNVQVSASGNTIYIFAATSFGNIYYVDASQTISIPNGWENIVTRIQTIDGMLVVDGRDTVLG